jgi:hypothetical protein
MGSSAFYSKPVTERNSLLTTSSIPIYFMRSFSFSFWIFTLSSSNFTWIFLGVLRCFFLCFSKAYFTCVSNIVELNWFISLFYYSFWQGCSGDCAARLKCLLHSLELDLNYVVHCLLLSFLLFCYLFYSFIHSCDEETEVIWSECGLQLSYKCF